MNLNSLQRYLLTIYAILILLLTFFVPTMLDGQFTYGFVFVKDSIGEVSYSYLIIELVVVTIAAIAAIFASKDNVKR